MIQRLNDGSSNRAEPGPYLQGRSISLLVLR
jgi:hypothetical protein